MLFEAGILLTTLHLHKTPITSDWRYFLNISFFAD